MIGRRPGGTFEYAVCKRCGARWGRWDDAPAYVASDEEWHREVGEWEERYARQLREWTAHRRNDP